MKLKAAVDVMDEFYERVVVPVEGEVEYGGLHKCYPWGGDEFGDIDYKRWRLMCLVL